MSEKLEQFKIEINYIKRIIDGYLSTNPSLAGFELDEISIKPKEAVIKSEIADVKSKNLMKEFGVDALGARCCQNIHTHKIVMRDKRCILGEEVEIQCPD